MQYGNTLTQIIENVRIPSVQRHTLVGVVMASTVLEGGTGEGHHILTKGTPTRAYQCKQ